MAEDLAEVKISSIIEQTLWVVSEKPESNFKDIYSCKLMAVLLTNLEESHEAKSLQGINYIEWTLIKQLIPKEGSKMR